MQSALHMMSALLRRIFHKRSIIIISKHNTNHVSVSGPLQFAVFAGFVACVSLASYSTGSYMSARSVMKVQERALKSVATSRIDTSFDYTMARLDPQVLGPASRAFSAPIADPAYAIPSMSNAKLFARIAILEDKVKALRNTNVEIIQAVREKTNNQIMGMESLIRQTGLNPDALKQEMNRSPRKNASVEKASPTVFDADIGAEEGQGGPFVPDETPGISPLSGDLTYRLDQVALLSAIISRLPLANPLKSGTVESSSYGRRIDPFTGRLAFHTGLDISAPVGSEVSATAAGKVVAAGWNGAYGNCVDVDHGFGVITRYGHLSAIKVMNGQLVKSGQIVGIQGSTGRSTGPHLHYEVRYYNKPLDPSNFLHAGYHVSQASQ